MIPRSMVEQSFGEANMCLDSQEIIGPLQPIDFVIFDDSLLVIELFLAFDKAGIFCNN